MCVSSSRPKERSEQVINENPLSIDQQSWKQYTEDSSSKKIAIKVATYIQEQNIRFPPISGITESEALQSFLSLKCAVKKGETFFLTEEKLEPRYHFQHKKLYNPTDTFSNPLYEYIILRHHPMLGGEASNFCQYPARVHSRCFQFPSPFEIWNGTSKSLRARLIQNLPSFVPTYVSDDTAAVTEKEAAKTISDSFLIPSQFPPYVIPAIVRFLREYAKVPTDELWKLLDPCAGWSDRLIGALASDSMISHYVAFDPNTALDNGQKRAVEVFPSSVKVKHILKCFEDMEKSDFTPYQDFLFDLVITSPPFFLKELYSSDLSQSSARYSNADQTPEKNLSSWIEGFLKPILVKSWGLLKPGRFLAIHFDDVSLEEKEQVKLFAVCDPMNDYIGRILEGKYIGAIGLAMEKIPSRSWGIQCEPIWIWQKIK
jgi:hypothetical protein